MGLITRLGCFFLQNGLLQELAEEWERCEKKLKDAGHWIEATSRTLEAPHSTKKPLRDRLALREKLINDISTQKTKISYAVEKLNVSLYSIWSLCRFVVVSFYYPLFFLGSRLGRL